MIGQATFMMMRLGLEREEVHMPDRMRRPFGLLGAGHFRAGDGDHLVGHPHFPNERVEVKYGVVFSGNHNLAMLGHKSADTLNGCKGIVETGGGMHMHVGSHMADRGDDAGGAVMVSVASAPSAMRRPIE